MNRKGMTMALGVIIAIVVLIVVALAVIAITTGSISRLFGSTDPTIDRSGSDIVGTQSCSSCAYTHTKGTVSTMDDRVRPAPYFCEDDAGNKNCCEDFGHSKCMPIDDCGTEKNDLIGERCTQARN
ncbi:MAG: hypothetical protein U9Q67_02345 [Patescibacteria group bacterium]|nr:hypothetical protein [Patescibacteria group bacterium]